MANPPEFAGAVQLSATFDAPGVSVASVGEPGNAAGLTDAEDVDQALVPIEFVADTLKMYAVPLVRPVTDSEVEPAAKELDQFVQLVPPFVE